ncbi:MAG: CotH kinase family protein [Lachnospiraceae bacterium]|nr:CotH kinase family protein [Lachnospiraceae bacterium]
MDKKERSGIITVVVAVIVALVAFVLLYREERIQIETLETEVADSSLSQWRIEDSSVNGTPLKEDKTIYGEVPEDTIYDVYISVFPTKSSNGEMLDFSAFGKHVSRDHTYNPVLNCNIQILNEDEKIDPLLNLDEKNATIRVRGNSSRGDTYKSYKVKFSNENDNFLGQKSLNINKHSEDVTKIATKMETALLAEIDNIASYRTYFMRVWIRDASLPKEQQKFEYYGLYTEIEQPNKTYLETRGLSSTGSMYKARNFSFDLVDELKDVDDPGYKEEEFETVLTIREAENHKKLLEMLEAVNDETNNFEEVFHKYFNEDNYLTWLAFNLLLGNDDIINHNFIIYNPGNSETWYFIPWDFDGTLHFGEYESSLMKLPTSLKGGQKLNQSILHRRYFRMEGSMEKIQKKMEELLENNVTRSKVTGLINGYKRVLDKTVSLEPDISLLEMPPNELPIYLDSLYDGILDNYEAFKIANQYPVPMYVAQPAKNSNGTIRFSWQPSYSYQGYPVTYNLQLFTDYNMTNMVLEAKNIVDTHYDTPSPLERGTYYLKVTAVDSKGHEQLSMERFETMLTDVKGLNVNGLLEVTID